jgi:hypothetical protein
VVIHNYRWRLGLAQGEPRYDALEQRLATAPSISVPTITMEGDANGAPHPDPSAYARKFTGKYAHRTVQGGSGTPAARSAKSVRGVCYRRELECEREASSSTETLAQFIRQ